MQVFRFLFPLAESWHHRSLGLDGMKEYKGWAGHGWPSISCKPLEGSSYDLVRFLGTGTVFVMVADGF